MSDRHYISVEGYQRLASELDRLLTVERPQVVNNVAAAAAEGDKPAAEGEKKEGEDKKPAEEKK